jgi:hypothetical protein
LTTKSFPFTAYGASGLLRPMILVDFPKTKNIYALVDSGASQSLMSIDMLVHEGMLIEKHSPTTSAVGVCGNSCLEISGTSESTNIRVSGFPNPINLKFTVVGRRHNLEVPILGIDFLSQVKATFKKESGKQAVEISD